MFQLFAPLLKIKNKPYLQDLDYFDVDNGIKLFFPTLFFFIIKKKKHHGYNQ